MTIREFFEKELCVNGMSKKYAHDVMEAVVYDNDEMRGRWGDCAEGYPPQLFAVLWMGIKAEALKWIDNNMPKAWFRPMFTEENA